MTKGIQESRTKKSVRNILTGFGSKLLLMAFSFLTKTIFIRLLGAEYNGVNGLYSNILTVLSLADLGIGNVLTFTLYKALREHNESELTTLIYSFKRIYRIIAFAVLGVGLMLVPFLGFIVNSSLPQNEIITYYILFLMNSVVSYFAVYKTTVITADQKGYISNICDTCVTVFMYVMQIVYLLIMHDFLGYLVIQVCCTVLKNVILTIIANRMYPFLNDKTLIDKSLLKKGLIWENLKSTFIYKICVVLINNTDNILISILVGTVYVGYYSNYSMLTSYVNSFISIFTTGMIASLGNLNAENNRGNSYRTFKTLGLIYAIIANFCVCCFANCLQDFIPIWIGEEYVMSNITVVAVLLVFYISTSINPVWMYRETMGLFKEVKYIMLVTLVINIAMSIILGKALGVCGVIFATSIAKLSTHFWYEPVILFRKKFKEKVSGYFKSYAINLICTIVSVVLSIYVCSFITPSIPGLIMRVFLCGLIVLVLEILFHLRSRELKELTNRALYIVKRVKK